MMLIEMNTHVRIQGVFRIQTANRQTGYHGHVHLSIYFKPNVYLYVGYFQSCSPLCMRN